ncbi:MAG: sulfoxide reductase heme-binding subunit YedZ [Oceanicoccus sp.]|jgi:sulfoxide reductase heme-binding subunit YedZ
MIKKLIKEIVLDGKIPYLMTMKKIALWLAWLTPLSVFFIPHEYKEFAETGWVVLVAVMIIRPLVSIFPDFKILRSLFLLRKEFGIFAGMMIMAHFAGFLITKQVSIVDIFTQSTYWQIDSYYFWGILGVLALIPVLLTSNKTTRLFLKRKWKSIQRLVYPLFIFGGIHIAILGESSGLVGVGILVLLLTLDKFKLKIRLPKNIKF